VTDLLIRGGLVVDGTGAPGVRADVAVTDGRITDVGDVAGRRAPRMIDARDRVVAPGFIDIHSHSDNSVFVAEAFESALHMGVTLVVCGNCGSSSAPVGGVSAEGG
jgi:N-acyl-D-amino-acid deacylase